VVVEHPADPAPGEVVRHPLPEEVVLVEVAVVAEVEAAEGRPRRRRARQGVAFGAGLGEPEVRGFGVRGPEVRVELGLDAARRRRVPGVADEGRGAAPEGAASLKPAHELVAQHLSRLKEREREMQGVK
jgi:hypothetical protein